jgi:tetratricopeptide (TPR) repeat protein
MTTAAPSTPIASPGSSPRGGWLFGPVPDLLLGCGVGYALVLVLLCFFGTEIRTALWAGALPFVSVLVGAPHYGATLLRVYERREDRRAYALFAVHATIVLALLFVIATRSVWLGSLLLTIYLSWSPWHYTGQNYGLALLFLRRRGVAVDPTTKRWVYASFLFSYVVVFLALHSNAPGAEYTPPLYVAEVYRVLSLGLPSVAGDAAFLGALGAYGVASCVAVVRLLRRGSLGAIAPSLLLAGTQALWFALPVAMRRFGFLSHLEPFAPQHAGWYFFFAALAHSVQYVWVTSYFAKNAPGFGGLPSYLGKALLAGTALWCVPALVFAPDVLGRVPYDAGLSALVAACVNLHHFVLDGAIWKLRDGRIARILLRTAEAQGAPPAPVAGRSWIRWTAWAAGAISLGIFTVGFIETEVGLRNAARDLDTARMRAAMERLDWIGRESATNHLGFGRVLEGKGETAAALHQYERSVELHPTVEGWVAIASIHEGAQRVVPAQEAIEHAVALAPSDPALLYRSASLARRSGDHERALARLERAVELDPDRTLFRRALERERARAAAAAAPSGAEGG